MQSIRKRNNRFRLIQQTKAHNVGKRYNNNFNTVNKCSRLIIVINTTGITKYKQSVI